MTEFIDLHRPQFPRTQEYNPEWILSAVSGGANSLWLTEWLSSGMSLVPGMNVLDLGCGRAASSIFLSREFGVNVWATDLWFDPTENQQRIHDAGLAKHVYPIHADARALPFPTEFFDAIISIDSFFYYGTDDLYLNYIARFLKPNGVIAIAGTGLMSEFNENVPSHLESWWSAERSLWCLHSAKWWQRHWQRTGVVDIELADSMPDGWKLWVDWLQGIAPDNRMEIEALQRDQGENLGYVRAIGRKRSNIQLDPPMWELSIPPNYEKKPLLRHSSN